MKKKNNSLGKRKSVEQYVNGKKENHTTTEVGGGERSAVNPQFVEKLARGKKRRESNGRRERMLVGIDSRWKKRGSTPVCSEGEKRKKNGM